MNDKVMNDKVMTLFKENKLLCRAMDSPYLRKQHKTNQFTNDFSTWANEYDIAKREGLYSLSTTLLVFKEAIPTYKAIGFLIDSEKADVRHISESDSVSNGNEKDGDFSANGTNIQSLSELATIVQTKHQKVMNEVNINMRENAYIGLFANKATSPRVVANIILAQKFYEMQTGDKLPIYIYDSKEGNLNNLNISIDEKNRIIQELLDNKQIRSSNVFYETESGDSKQINFYTNIEKESNNKIDANDEKNNINEQLKQESKKEQPAENQQNSFIEDLRQNVKEINDQTNNELENGTFCTVENDKKQEEHRVKKPDGDFVM